MSPDAERERAEGEPRPEAPETDQAGSAAGPVPDTRAASGVVLPREVQEHIGQQLRTEYDAVAEKPTYLGDPAIPEQFDWHLARLETRERAHTRAVEAVERALEEIVLEQEMDEDHPSRDAEP